MRNTSYKPAEDTAAEMNWILDDEGVLTVSGNGRIPDYSCGKNPAAPWEDRKEKILNLVIEEGITEIGINAFRDCANLKKAIIAKSVHRVHAYAFRNCTELEHIEAGERKWRYVYDKANIQKSDTIVFGVETFLNVPWANKFWNGFYCNQDMLYVCFASGDTIEIPDSIRVLKSFCFSHIEAGKMILPEKLETIEALAFSNTVIEERLCIPDEIQKIDPYAFADGRYPSISFPSSWRPDKIRWERTETKMNRRQNYPAVMAKYSVGMIQKENMGRFRRLKVIEKKAVRHENGQITEVEDRPVSVGSSILRRLYAGKILLSICCEDNKVSAVRSFIWNAGYQLVNEYQMYPVYMEDRDAEIWSDSFTWQEQFDIELAFSDHNGADLKQAGVLRFLAEGMQEEWFWTENDGNFGGPLELEFLNTWLSRHPEIQVYSRDENMEKEKYRLFVSV